MSAACDDWMVHSHAARPHWLELDRHRGPARRADTARPGAALVAEVHGRRVRVGDQWLIDFTSGGLLGFDLDPVIRLEIESAVDPAWVDPGADLLGFPRRFPEVEARLTALLRVADTLVLPAVTSAHPVVLPALSRAVDWVLLPGDAPLAMVDGCRQLARQGVTVVRFAAGDLEGLRRLLTAGPSRQLVCVQAVDRSTGNHADHAGDAALCRRAGALLYVDDTYGFGLLGTRDPDESGPYGTRGDGTLRHLGLRADHTVLVCGLARAYSTPLAFVALPPGLRERLVDARPCTPVPDWCTEPYLYAGPSPAAARAGALAALDANADRGDALRAHLHRLTGRILAHLRCLGARTTSVAGTPIVHVPVRADADLDGIVRALWRRGVHLSPTPVTATAGPGLRVQVTAAHTDDDVDELNLALGALAGTGTLQVSARVGRQRI